MSFKVNWPTPFSDVFIDSAKIQLNDALNKGDKPSNIVGYIETQELNMGTTPPELEILEIGELGDDRFRGIFKLTYAADAYVVLQTKVQANPLSTPKVSMSINNRVGMLCAQKPLVVPMELRISSLKLRGICALVVDKHKGVTLAFKNDPLESVSVNSTFDNVPNIALFLQTQIESQLRKMFQDDIPQLIYKLSLIRISEDEKNKERQNTERFEYDNPEYNGKESDYYYSDSAYYSTDDRRKVGDYQQRTVMNEYRPHHLKWNGNDANSDCYSDEYYTVNRNISEAFSGPQNNSIGLNTVAEDNIYGTNPRAISRLSISTDHLPMRPPPSVSIRKEAHSPTSDYSDETRSNYTTFSSPSAVENYPAHRPNSKFKRFSAPAQSATPPSRAVRYYASSTISSSRSEFAGGAPSVFDEEDSIDDLTREYYQEQGYYNYRSSSHEDLVPVEFNPKDNETAAHLVNLFNVNHTLGISVITPSSSSPSNVSESSSSMSLLNGEFEHFAFRTSPRIAEISAKLKRRKKVVRRNAVKMTLPPNVVSAIEGLKKVV